MSEEKAKAALKITIPVLFAVISIFLAPKLLAASGYAGYCTEALNENRNTVLKLSASSAAASSAITALPGDLATPIATELAQMSKNFLIVLCALYLEKFVVAVSGTLVFQWLIPAACGLFVLGILLKKETLRALAVKVSIFATALLLVVPASVKLSELVEDSYEESISQVIESAENSASQIKESVDGSKDPAEAGNGLGKIVQSLKNSGDRIANGTSQMIDYFERLLSRFVESLAILLVISCVIPLLVLLAFVWLVKALFQLEIKLPGSRGEKEQRRIHEKQEE